MKETVELALVGGGSTATSFLAQFVMLFENKPFRGGKRIVVFDPAATPGVGEPYAPDLSSNLLNIPAGRMSVYAENRRDFFCWLQKQDKEYLASHGVTTFCVESFLPRSLFGDYLRTVWEDTVQRAMRCEILIEHCRAYVTDIQRDSDSQQLIIQTSEGAVHAHHALLCNGNLASTAYTELRGAPGYFHSPYPVMQVANSIPPQARVGVIGTSLSAIDAIVALKETGHKGSVYAVSRSGRLPSVRSTVAPLQPIEPPTVDEIEASISEPSAGLTLEDMYHFLCQRVQMAGGKIDLEDMLGRGGPALESLGKEIHTSATQARVWQEVAISLNETIEHAWRLMADNQRLRLYADWRATWMIRRATFPMDNAVKIRRYLENRDLRILVGGAEMSIIRGKKSGFYIQVQDLQLGTRQENVDYLINATGMSTDVTRTQDPFVNALLQKGMAVPDAYGGFKLDFETSCLVDSEGCIQRDITVLGSLCVGTYFWTMSLDVNARLALAQAQNMVNKWNMA